ncbi:MAG: hypothetical protein E7073_06705 [Bacteroidales bacterium]|jgi:hypothetical protein|nr:hypothetical protein [Bacteroidales bacterium]
MKRILPVLMILISCSVYSQDAKEEKFCGEYGRLLGTYDFPQLLEKLDSLRNSFELQEIQIGIEVAEYERERLDFHWKNLHSSLECDLAMSKAHRETDEFRRRRLDSLYRATGVTGYRYNGDAYPVPYPYRDCE